MVTRKPGGLVAVPCLKALSNDAGKAGNEGIPRSGVRVLAATAMLGEIGR